MNDIIANERHTTSRKIKVRKEKIENDGSKRGFLRYLFDLVINWIFVTTLISINFALFAGAGNNNLFSSAFVVSAPAMYIFTGIAVVSFLLLFAVSFSRVLKYLVTSVAAGLFVVMMFSHFTLFDETAFLSVITSEFTSMPSHVIFAILAGFIVFLFLCFSAKSTLFYTAATLLVIFVWILFSSHVSAVSMQREYEVLHEEKSLPLAEGEEKGGKRFVYIGFPNLASYSYMRSLEGVLPDASKAEKVSDIMLAFYMRHGFMLYPNAYVKDNDAFKNMIRSLNVGSVENPKDAMLSGISIDGYWKFDKLNDKYYHLRNNKLYDVFNKGGYKISAYQTRKLDLCRNNDKLAVEKCVNKVNKPANLKKLNITNDKKARILLFQWIESMNIVNDSEMVKGFLRTWFGGDGTPIDSTSYKNLYVINSFETLDMLAKDIINADENRAFFAVVDLPSDLFIYNEYCQPKHPDMWSSAAKQNAKVNNVGKKNAYIDQTMCLFGKLEQFMNKLEEAGVADNTVVILEGLSSISSLNTGGINFVDEFKSKNLVNLAIRDPLKKGFRLNMEMCKSSEILRRYLFKKGPCSDLDDMSYQGESKNELKKSLMERLADKNKAERAMKTMNEWYPAWLKLNDIKKFDEVSEDETSAKEPFGDINIDEIGLESMPDVVPVAETEEIKEDESFKTMEEYEKENPGSAVMIEEPALDADEFWGNKTVEDVSEAAVEAAEAIEEAVVEAGETVVDATEEVFDEEMDEELKDILDKVFSEDADVVVIEETTVVPEF